MVKSCKYVDLRLVLLLSLLLVSKTSYFDGHIAVLLVMVLLLLGSLVGAVVLFPKFISHLF